VFPNLLQPLVEFLVKNAVPFNLFGGPYPGLPAIILGILPGIPVVLLAITRI
jgi:hypothetical protein